MGYAFVVGRCVGCKGLFTFNPIRVPSVRVEGVKEPVCKDCIDAANVIREHKGMDLLTYASDAYEAVDETELG